MRRIVDLVLVISLILVLLIPMSISAFADDEPVITKVETRSQTINAGNSFTVTVYASMAGQLDSETSSVELTRTKQSDDEYAARKYGYLTDKGNGKYEAVFDVTDEWISGEYVISSIRMADKGRNYTDISSSDGTIIPKDVTYTIKTSNTDALPPEITKIEAESGTYYLGEGIKITVYINDPSGVDAERCQVSISIPDNLRSGTARWLEDAGDGKYETIFKVDDYYEAGDYIISTVTACDKYRNNITYMNKQLDATGDPNNVIPDNVFTVVKEENPNPSPIPSDNPTPSESPAPSETVKPSESPKPSETGKPTESPAPSDFPNQVTAYSDVPENSWYTTAVYYAESKGYMNGVGGGKFNPTGTVTRGTIAQILYAAEGKPEVTGISKFTDVADAKWYAKAVKWAADKGLVSGYGNGKFGPDNAVTREQMVAIMYKYSEMKGYDLKATADLSKFADQNQISKYAVNSVKWGVDHKIISGTNKGIEPKGNATRAQIAVILQAYDNNVRQ